MDTHWILFFHMENYTYWSQVLWASCQKSEYIYINKKALGKQSCDKQIGSSEIFPTRA